MKVYVVEEGSYSDRHVEAVFDSRKKAEEYCAVHTVNAGFDYHITEFRLNPSILFGDKVMYCYEFCGEESSRLIDVYFVLKSNIASFKKSRWKDPVRYVFLEEPDEKKATKIYNDRMAEIRAKKEGISL